jgi:hypothetical protein
MINMCLINNNRDKHLDRLTNECDGLRKQIRELTAIVDEPFQGSDDDLQLLIDNFRRNQDEKKRELDDVRHSRSHVSHVRLISVGREKEIVRTTN